MAQTSSSNALYALTGIVSGISYKNDRKGRTFANFRFATKVDGKDTVRTSLAFGKNAQTMTALSDGDSVTLLVAFDGGTFRMAGVPKAKEAAAA